jgi:hypothetical protein
MFKSALSALLAALAASGLVSRLLSNYWSISNTALFFNLSFLLLCGIIGAVLSIKRSKTPDFPAFLLGALVVRLLACLVYLLLWAFIQHNTFKIVAFHFLPAFVLFTVADIWLSTRLLLKK